MAPVSIICIPVSRSTIAEMRLLGAIFRKSGANFSSLEMSMERTFCIQLCDQEGDSAQIYAEFEEYPQKMYTFRFERADLKIILGLFWRAT
jgi:hypothetical protein